MKTVIRILDMLPTQVGFIFFWLWSLYDEYRGAPIVTSLMDVDMYKLTMMQAIWKKKPRARVKYRFNNRDKGNRLPKTIRFADLERELRSVVGKKFSRSDIEYLRTLRDKSGRRIFRDEFLDFLLGFEMPGFTLGIEGEEFLIEAQGLWSNSILWETIVMSIVSELYSRQIRRERGLSLLTVWISGDKRLSEKISKLQEFMRIIFSDFGTRRRFSKHWQMYAIWRMKREIPEQFHSTSNLWMAKTLGVTPVGSMAHEMFMVYAALMGETDEGLRSSHNKVLQDWWEVYGAGLSIALTDTFTTDFFFEDFTTEQAKSWWGYRQDSGDPFEFGKRLIAFLRDNGVEPSGSNEESRMCLFSDGLDLDTIIKLHLEFRDLISDRYGWGTGLMNDMGIDGVTFSLRIVMKAVAAFNEALDAWVGTVKLSDTKGKYTGSSENIDRHKRVFVGEKLTV